MSKPKFEITSYADIEACRVRLRAETAEYEEASGALIEAAQAFVLEKYADVYAPIPEWTSVLLNPPGTLTWSVKEPARLAEARLKTQVVVRYPWYVAEHPLDPFNWTFRLSTDFPTAAKRAAFLNHLAELVKDAFP